MKVTARVAIKQYRQNKVGYGLLMRLRDRTLFLSRLNEKFSQLYCRKYLENNEYSYT